MSRAVAGRSAKVTVTTSSTAVASRNPGRHTITVVNLGTNPVYLTLETSAGTDPTASTANGGVYLSTGGSWTEQFGGAVAGIATGGSSDVTVMEI